MGRGSSVGWVREICTEMQSGVNREFASKCKYSTPSVGAIMPALVALDGGRACWGMWRGRMRGFGYLLIALGSLGILAGLAMDTSVSGGVGVTNRVVNIGLLSQQTAILTLSGFSFMTGCMLVGFAAVRDAIERLVSITNAPVVQRTASSLSGSSHEERPPVAEAGRISIGSRVQHQTFGKGTVQAFEGDSAFVIFDGRDKPMPMNAAYLRPAAS